VNRLRLTEAQMEKVAAAYALETGMPTEAIIGALTSSLSPGEKQAGVADLAKGGLSLLKGLGNVGSKVARMPGKAAGGAAMGTLKGAAKFAIKRPMGTMLAVGAVGTGIATAKKHNAMTGHGRGVAKNVAEMRRQRKISPGHQWSGNSASGMRF
jgi:hypothetical protein